MDDQKLIDLCRLIVGIFLIMGIDLVLVNVYETNEKFQTLAKDTNTLLNNDVAMANYIQANSTTMQYLNENCKQTNDNNTTITLTCLKVKTEWNNLLL